VFALLDTKNPTIIVVSVAVIVSLTHAVMFAPQAAFFPEMFGTRTRYSGASIGCQVSAAISGGFSPVIATGLMAAFGASWPISIYLALLGLVTLVAALASIETTHLDLSRQ